MSERKERGVLIAGSIGGLMIVAHLALAGAGVALLQWVGGAVVGLLLVVGTTIHVALRRRRRRNRGSADNR